MSTRDLEQDIHRHVLICRGQRVMLDSDLANLYRVETRTLVQAVKRNATRFPHDFMFQLSSDEFTTLKSQSVISNGGRGGRRTPPYAFTEQGVAMLSSVLGSERAVAVNIEIMRTFVRMRSIAMSHDELAKRLRELDERTNALQRRTREQLEEVFAFLRALMAAPASVSRPIGFVTPEDKGSKP